jgi:hypothetical protein
MSKINGHSEVGENWYIEGYIDIIEFDKESFISI